MQESAVLRGIDEAYRNIVFGNPACNSFSDIKCTGRVGTGEGSTRRGTGGDEFSGVPVKQHYRSVFRMRAADDQTCHAVRQFPDAVAFGQNPDQAVEPLW